MPTLEATRKAHPSDVLKTVLADAASAQEERRMNGRIPFFMPSLLELEGSTEKFSIFTRDISPAGIGLLHWMLLPPQDANLIISLTNDQVVRLNIKILWCVASGGGWYISGGGFNDAEFVARNVPLDE
jgi:hypothetical protein